MTDLRCYWTTTQEIFKKINNNLGVWVDGLEKPLWLSGGVCGGRTRACLNLEITGVRFQYILTQTILFVAFCQLGVSCPHWMHHNLGISGLKTEHSTKQCSIKYDLGVLVHCVF